MENELIKSRISGVGSNYPIYKQYKKDFLLINYIVHVLFIISPIGPVTLSRVFAVLAPVICAIGDFCEKKFIIFNLIQGNFFSHEHYSVTLGDIMYRTSETIV